MHIQVITNLLPSRIPFLILQKRTPKKHLLGMIAVLWSSEIQVFPYIRVARRDVGLAGREMGNDAAVQLGLGGV